MNKDRRSFRNLREEEILWVGKESVTGTNPESNQVQDVKRNANSLILWRWEWEGKNKPLPKTGVCRHPHSVCAGKSFTTSSPEKKKYVNECIYKFKFYWQKISGTQFTTTNKISNILSYKFREPIDSHRMFSLNSCTYSWPVVAVPQWDDLTSKILSQSTNSFPLHLLSSNLICDSLNYFSSLCILYFLSWNVFQLQH